MASSKREPATKEMDGSYKEHKVLFQLVRAGLWERVPEDTSLFPLTPEQWSEVYRLACQQTVVGIVFRGMDFLPAVCLPPEPVLARWVAAVDAIERKNLKTYRILDELYAFFRRQGLHPILQKGQGVALYYERPLLRVPGDIDLYFSTKNEFRTAVRSIRSRGISIFPKSDGSVEFRWRGLEVELHSRFLDVYNPLMQRRVRGEERRFGYTQVRLSEAPHTSVLVPSGELELLLLSAHILKHAVGWGVGLRQLCDMARACHRLCGSYDRASYRCACRRAGLGRWSRLLDSFLSSHLGLPPGELPYGGRPCPPGALLGVVLRGGNFGLYAPGRRHPSSPAWRRKLLTSSSFLRNAGFSLRYAPGEAFWIFTDLLKGQFN